MAFKRSAVRSRLSPPIENVESMQTLRFAWIFYFSGKVLFPKIFPKIGFNFLEIVMINKNIIFSNNIFYIIIKNTK